MKTFMTNGYPRNMIEKTMRRPTRQRDQEGEPQRDPEEAQEKPKVLFLPYVKNTSEEIERECRKLGVRTVFKTHGTLRQALMKVKTPREDVEKKDVVYEVPCLDCHTSYIGETGRNLK